MRRNQARQQGLTKAERRDQLQAMPWPLPQHLKADCLLAASVTQRYGGDELRVVETSPLAWHQKAAASQRHLVRAAPLISLTAHR